MSKLMMSVFCAVCAAFGAYAAGNDATTMEIARQPAVNEMLLEDDGVSIVTKEDGSFLIFTRGTGVYRFVDPQVELNARKVARLNAEKNLAEFIKKVVEGKDNVEQLQKVSSTLDGDGKVQATHASAEQLETVQSTITSSTKAVLSGLVLVESKKIPTEGTTSGVIQVTMVYSSKTAGAAAWVGRKMQEHQAGLAGGGRQSNGAGGNADTGVQAPAAAGFGTAVGTPANKAEHRVNKTEF